MVLDTTANGSCGSRGSSRVGSKVALQGNLDPNVLFAQPQQIRDEVEKVLNAFGAPAAGSGHVFNLGHGISQYTPPEAVDVLVETVHAHSRKMRTANAS